MGEVRLAEDSADAIMDAFASRFNGGWLRLYGGAVMLTELRFARPAFYPSSNGVIVARTIAPDTSAAESGTATWYRAHQSDGAAIVDGSVGQVGGGFDLELETPDIVSGARVSITSFTYTYPLRA